MSMKISDFKDQFVQTGDVMMPVLFTGHGNPMNAIEDNEFTREWESLGKTLPLPKAILCVSAHRQTNGTSVNGLERPKTIHDFYGFPEALFAVEYTPPGAPDFAAQTQQIITNTAVQLDYEWGLDHGCWSVLRRMFPAADIPTFQLSLDRTATAQQHFEIAQQLKLLRSKGVLIIGSGNIVHNLRLMKWQDTGYDWAIEFDQKIKNLLENGDDRAIVNFNLLGKEAALSIPTSEHYLPLLYSLGLKEKSDDIKFFTEKVTMGSVSMRGVKIG